MDLIVDKVLYGSVQEGMLRFFDLSGMRFFNGCEYTSFDGVSIGNFKTTNFFKGFMYDFTAMNYYVEMSEVETLVSSICGYTWDSS